MFMKNKMKRKKNGEISSEYKKGTHTHAKEKKMNVKGLHYALRR